MAMVVFSGQVEAAQILRIKKNLVGMYSKMTGRTPEQIIKDLDRDNYLSAQEALEHGQSLTYSRDHGMGQARRRIEG
jgi:hypothetical protein